MSNIPPISAKFGGVAEATNAQLVGLAGRFGTRVYQGFKDKGDDRHDSTLYDHCKRVEGHVIDALQHKISNDQLNIRRAVAIVHDFPELSVKDASGKKQRVRNLQQWMAEMFQAGFPEVVVEATDGVAIREDEHYLEYIRRCARNPISLDVKLDGDLEDHKQRTDNHHTKTDNQLFLDKTVNGMYEMARLYLRARRDQRIGDISVAEFIMTEPSVPRALKNREVLRRNSSMCTKIPNPIYAGFHREAMHRLRRGWQGMMNPRRAAVF